VKPLIIRPSAAADIEDAYRWYETHRRGLGAEFREALREALANIAENPARYPMLYRGTRRALLKRFPYGVYYREHPDVIAVVACMHGSRNPRRWQSRI